jgi:hypothetical protein
MHYAGQTLRLSSTQSFQQLQQAVQASEAQLTRVRLEGNDGWALVLLGGGTPVAFTGLADHDLPET